MVFNEGVSSSSYTRWSFLLRAFTASGMSSSSSELSLRRAELLGRCDEVASEAMERSCAWSLIWLRSRDDWRAPDLEVVLDGVDLNCGVESWRMPVREAVTFAVGVLAVLGVLGAMLSCGALHCDTVKTIDVGIVSVRMSGIKEY